MLMKSLLSHLALCAALGGFAACSSTPESPLPEGTWTGALTPMNHPEMANPVTYAVRYDDGALAIDLIGPNGSATTTRDVQLEADTLRFAFDEPEEGITLRCALGGTAEHGFAGRCADASGKWARFTMAPPAS